MSSQCIVGGPDSPNSASALVVAPKNGNWETLLTLATALMLRQFSSQTLQKLLSRTGMLLYFLSVR